MIIEIRTRFQNIRRAVLAAIDTEDVADGYEGIWAFCLGYLGPDGIYPTIEEITERVDAYVAADLIRFNEETGYYEEC